MSRRQNIAIAKHPVKGTGQLSQAELGLDYYVARWYDPMTGHFTQADSIIPEPGNVGNYDRYSYAQNNPIRFMDPYGHGIDCGVGESGCNKSSDLRKWKEFSQQKNLEERNEKILINIADSLNTPQYYITGWDNFSTAWTIFWNPNSSWFQKDIAAEYMRLWITGNLALFVGVAGLSYAATGPACVKAVDGALGIATYVSADGNPTNEIQTINTGIYTVYQYMENGVVNIME